MLPLPLYKDYWGDLMILQRLEQLFLKIIGLSEKKAETDRLQTKFEITVHQLNKSNLKMEKLEGQLTKDILKAMGAL